MRAFDSLKRRGDFARVTRRGKRHAGSHLTCFVADGRRVTRVGVTIGSSVGGAVIRNRLRRRIKAILDGRPLGTSPWRDIVIIARPSAAELGFAELAEAVARGLGPP